MTTITTTEAIRAANTQLTAAFRAGDAAAMSACYTISCLLLPPGREMVAGRAGVQAYWQGMMNIGVVALTMETSELAEYGQSAVEIGHYRIAFGAGQVVDRGKYVVVWQQEGGAWQLSRDIWNSNLGPAGRIFAILRGALSGAVKVWPRRRQD